MTSFQVFIDFIKFASSTSSIILVVNIILFVWLAFKTEAKTHRILALYLLTIFIIQNYGAWLAFNGINNLFGTHYYFILQLLWLSYFYYLICKLPIQKKIIRYSVIACLLVLAIQYTIKPELYFIYNELEVFMCSYLLIIFTLFHFYNILGTSKKFLFFTIGLFVYMFGSTILFLLGNLSIILDLGKVTADLNIIMYTLFQLFILAEFIFTFYVLKPIHFKSKILNGRY